MITAIEVSNFKSFRNTTTFRLAPLTFLFGENNVGKSTLIEAIDFFEAMVVSGSPNVHVFPKEYQKRSFEIDRVLHGNPIGGDFSLAATFALSEEDLHFFECPSLAGGKADEWLPPTKVDLNFGDDFESLKISFNCSWGFDRDEIEVIPPPRLDTTTIFVNDLELITIRGPFATSMVRFLPTCFVEWKVNSAHPIFPDGIRAEGKTTVQPLYENQIPGLSDFPIIFGLNSSFVPPIPGTENIFLNYINSLVVGAFRIARHRLTNRRTISGIRVVPDSAFFPQDAINRNRWNDGSAAWDILADVQNADLVDEVNKTLKDDLKCGYVLLAQKMIDERIVHQFTLNPRDLARLDANITALRRVGFARYNGTEIEAGELRFPSEVGTGLSQVVPVITACHLPEGGLTCVSQPELHLHPRLQSELADVFIQAMNRKRDPASFILETHSEHFLLRFLRRIRESHRKQASARRQVTPDQIVIYHFRQSDGVSSVSRIDVDEHGELIQPWPDNFFELDFYERFS